MRLEVDEDGMPGDDGGSGATGAEGAKNWLSSRRSKPTTSTSRLGAAVSKSQKSPVVATAGAGSAVAGGASMRSRLLGDCDAERIALERLIVVTATGALSSVPFWNDD